MVSFISQWVSWGNRALTPFLDLPALILKRRNAVQPVQPCTSQHFHGISMSVCVILSYSEFQTKHMKYISSHPWSFCHISVFSTKHLSWILNRNKLIKKSLESFLWLTHRKHQSVSCQFREELIKKLFRTLWSCLCSFTPPWVFHRSVMCFVFLECIIIVFYYI